MTTANAKKLARFEAADTKQQNDWEDDADAFRATWKTSPNLPYQVALDFFETVPPLRSGPSTTCSISESMKKLSQKERKLSPLKIVVADDLWVDDIVEDARPSFALTPGNQSRRHIAQVIQNRFAPFQLSRLENTERDTDEYHLSAILGPAARIAGAILNVSLVTASGAVTEGTAADITVASDHGPQRTWLTVEDQRSSVFLSHLRAFYKLAIQPFPWPTDEEMQDPNWQPEIPTRMWIQIWGQMLAYDVEVAKLFSPVGVVYIKRDKTELPGTLHLSKTYDDLDGDIKRTAACILWAHNRQTSWDASASSPMARIEASLLQWLFSLLSAVYLAGLWCWGIRGVYVRFTQERNQRVFFRDVSNEFDVESNITAHSFTTKLAFGARGTVMRSAGGSEVIKLFWNKAAARREVFFLESARGLNVPVVRGVVTDEDRIGVVMRYEGSPINFNKATECQKRQLRDIVAKLHERGIHHHDIREPNILVGEEGDIRLVDFEDALQISNPNSAECADCFDTDAIDNFC